MSPFLLVARSVHRPEQKANPNAKAAIRKEWDKLRGAKRPDGGIGAWDQSKVREAKAVREEYRRKAQKVHICDVFALCVEKGSELPKEHADRKMKGRVCLRGNDVKDENYQWALVEEQGSQPANMTSGKVVDAYGVQKGNKTKMPIPKEEWPEAWIKAGFIDPVCPLILNLYGHPDAGTYWQDHCDTHLRAQNFEPVDEWPSCYFHKELKCLLIVYVDDF